ncbi:MAG: response regulator transcription factor [Acidimicrobiales bacterium]
METDVHGGTIKIAVIDGHQMFAESLVRLLEGEADLEVVAVGPSAVHLGGTWDQVRPDVVILDHYLPDPNGTEAISTLSDDAFRPKFILLSGDGSQTLARQAALVGCVAVLTKDRAAWELIELIRAAHAGTLTPPSTDAAAEPGDEAQPGGGGGAVDSHTPGVPFRLSPRETEVLRMLAEGSGTQHIAEALFISRNTVRAHVQRVITKLGTHSKLEAVAVARRSGLL